MPTQPYLATQDTARPFSGPLEAQEADRHTWETSAVTRLSGALAWFVRDRHKMTDEDVAYCLEQVFLACSPLTQARALDRLLNAAAHIAKQPVLFVPAVTADALLNAATAAHIAYCAAAPETPGEADMWLADEMRYLATEITAARGGAPVAPAVPAYDVNSEADEVGA